MTYQDELEYIAEMELEDIMMDKNKEDLDQIEDQIADQALEEWSMRDLLRVNIY